MELHQIVFEAVQEIVNKHDPIGLVSGGAPDDEYHTEIGQIVSLLRNTSNKEILAREIGEIFKKFFGEIETDEDSYLALSEDLLELKRKLKW